MDIDIPRERITSARANRPVNSSSIARSIMRQRTFSEPMSFKALFSATRIRSYTSMNPSNDNPSRSSQNADTNDQELGTNILSANVSQESCYKPLRSNTSNTASQGNRDDSSTSRSTSQYPNKDSGMLLHTTVTNSRANQEITTGLSIQSNVMSEQSSRTATVVPHISRVKVFLDTIQTRLIDTNLSQYILLRPENEFQV